MKEGAALPSVVALRMRACDAYDRLLSSRDQASQATSFDDAISHARRAADQGEAADGEVLVFLLARFAEWLRAQGRDTAATTIEAEALNLAGELADAGDIRFAAMVANSASALSVKTLQEAARQRAAVSLAAH